MRDLSQSIIPTSPNLINSTNLFVITELVIVVLYNSVECVELLLSVGADTEIRGEYGKSAPVLFNYKNYARIVKVLLEHGAGIDSDIMPAAQIFSHWISRCG